MYILGKVLALTVFLISSIFLSISALLITEKSAPLVFIINAGGFFISLNVSKNVLTNIPVSFLSCPIPPCNQCPTNRKQNVSLITVSSLTNCSLKVVVFL